MTTKPVQQLVLVDCNNFYVSCERLFRPDLLNTPMVVLSNNDGCVVSRSNEAKAMGVKMGQPWFECQHLADSHGLMAMSSNYALYADISNRVMAVLESFAPRQEVYSIDESFLDLTGMRAARDCGYAIRERVGRWIGIPVCAGIGPTKTLAKLANHVAKKHPRSRGVFDFNLLTATQKTHLLARIPVGEVWGIGSKLSNRLSRHNILTAYDLKTAHAPTLRAEFGVVVEKVQRELQEVPCLKLEEITPPKQQIVCSRSFGQSVTELPHLLDAIATFMANACAKLREQSSQASVVQVFLQTNPFRADLQQYTPCMAVPLPQPTADTLELNGWAAELCRQMWKPGIEYKKAGVILTEITPSSRHQGDLLEAEKTGSLRLMETLDRLNTRFGRGTVKISAQGVFEQWQMRQQRKSPNYTTSWSELPTV